MKKRRLLRTLTAGAALSVAGCATPGPERTANPPPPELVEPPPPPEPTANPPVPPPPEPTANPPAPPPPDEPINVNPPSPEPDIVVPTVQALPTWDEVESGHPKGATNPPVPELVVTPSGDCFKAWRSPMAPPTGEFGDRVQDTCDADCGTPIQCPDRAKELLDAHTSGGNAGSD